MFSGIIEDVGRVRRMERRGESARLEVETKLPVTELRLGDSVAVSGACLTVVALGERSFTVDVSPETLRRTTLGELRPQDPVNLERALRLSDRLGGHLVNGHVEGTAEVTAIRREANAILLTFRVPPALARYVVEKGCIAVDGVSLTVNAVRGPEFSVAVIPFTAAETTLGGRRVGDRVNVETDIIGKYVERFLRGAPGVPEVDEALLAERGFA
ncbi:MAG: riboflavin synthase [Deltaproteobacteria bacterium]|nr:riboflavin synthase [Deltaproteobacteria bacterium]